MKVTKVVPEIVKILITIEGIKHKDNMIDIEVTADVATGEYLSAYCKSPYFMVDVGLWRECFGEEQANRIREYCKQEVEQYNKLE